MNKHSDPSTLAWLEQQYGPQAIAKQETEDLPQFVSREVFEAFVQSFQVEVTRLKATVAQLCATNGIQAPLD